MGSSLGDRQQNLPEVGVQGQLRRDDGEGADGGWCVLPLQREGRMGMG